MPGLRTSFAILLLVLPLAPASALAGDALPVAPAQLDAGYWIAKLPKADRVVLDANAIAARNAALPKLEPTWHDLAALPASLDRDAVRARIFTRDLFHTFTRACHKRDARASFDQFTNEGEPESGRAARDRNPQT